MIYVDELHLYPGKGRWCHMATDGNLTELHALARKVGLKLEWFQDHKRCPHYDLTPAKRGAAVRMGACEVKATELWKHCNIVGKHKDSISPAA